MKYLDLTLPTPQENLACDEALLEWCEESDDGEILRFWESPQYFVALGYANKVAEEVNQEATAALNIPVLRRCSGGGTVLQGPGCLNYALFLRARQEGIGHGVTETNHFVMQRQRQALESVLGMPVQVEGYTDLALNGRKFSGNAQRRKQRYLLFHGTFLLSFDLLLIQQVLRAPPKQPEYRQQRDHTGFLVNLHLEAGTLQDSLCKVWNAHEPLTHFPRARVEQLGHGKYSANDWNFKL